MRKHYCRRCGRNPYFYSNRLCRDCMFLWAGIVELLMRQRVQNPNMGGLFPRQHSISISVPMHNGMHVVDELTVFEQVLRERDGQKLSQSWLIRRHNGS